MRREIQITSDGSTTIHLPDWDENYHSKHGAIQEAKYVFIKNGLALFENELEVNILEVGFGTGLNAFITYLETKKNKQLIDYVGVEAYPISGEEVAAMNYAKELNAIDDISVFQKMHSFVWEKSNLLSSTFVLTKRKQFFDAIDDQAAFDLIYFDAFGYRVQPELWTADIFSKMYNALKPDGILVTYAARGVVKRNMIEVGFTVEKLPGPPGKREMFRARKSLLFDSKGNISK
jgi:tRNA U34 5-methylaminomethyl-2-thiouridine-forming methyltransferase MnmC